MTHIAAFVAPVLTEKKDAYLAIAERMSSFFKENGALRVVECWGAEIPEGKLTSFPQSVQKKDTETIVLSWIEWPSKDMADAAWAKMDQDKELMEVLYTAPMDSQRMFWGSFETMLDV